MNAALSTSSQPLGHEQLRETVSTAAEHNYTYHATTKLEKQIAQDMQLVLKLLEQNGAMQHITAILLGGRYATGEAGFLIDAQGEEQLQEPYLFVIIVKKLAGWRRAFFNQKLLEVKHRLRRHIQVAVHFSKVLTQEELKHKPVTLQWYQLKWGHRLLWGAAQILQELPIAKHQRFPPAAALELLLEQGRRLILFKRRLLAKHSLMDIWANELQQTFLSCGASYLLLHHCYHVRLGSCARELQKMALSDEFLAETEFASLYWRALQQTFRRRCDVTGGELRKALPAVLQCYERFYFKLMTVSAKRAVGSAHAFVQVMKLPQRHAGVFKRPRLKYVLSNVLAIGPGSLRDRWVLFHPRVRLYVAILGILVDGLAGSGILVKLSNEALGLVSRKGHTSRSLSFLRLWRDVYART